MVSKMKKMSENLSKKSVNLGPRYFRKCWFIVKSMESKELLKFNVDFFNTF